MQGYWQGERVGIRHVNVEVTRTEDKPLYWTNYAILCAKEMNSEGQPIAIIEALEITSLDTEETFLISNQFGEGVRKVREENGGWPNVSHSSFNPDTTKIIGEVEKPTLIYDFEGIKKFNDMRDGYNSRKYPKLWERVTALKKSIQNRG